MTGARLSLDEAKARLDVATLWRVLNLPGQPSRSCRCPLHEDRSASFSVFVSQKGALRWKCHAGCGEGGPVELLARVLSIDEREACRRLLELADGDEVAATWTPPRSKPASVPPSERRLLLPSGMNPGSLEDHLAVARQRGLSVAGVQLANARGLLWFSEQRGTAAWIVTDRERINAQARRMDGGLWEHIGDKKAWTLPGSRAAWPIGCRESEGFPFVVLVEGGPDLLAAHHFIIAEGREADVAAIAVLGASNDIPVHALKVLANKHVRIYPHVDRAGGTAAVAWAAQLERVDCTVDAFDLEGLRRVDGGTVKDLNDLAAIDPDCYEAESETLERILPE